MRQISMLWCVPDEFISWLPFAYVYGLKIIKKHKIDLIYANDSPHTCSIIALILSKTTGIPFITDFRDLWTSNPEFAPRNKFEKLVQTKLERNVLRNAGKMITTTHGFANELSRMNGSNMGTKLEIIYNGFDLDDFKSGKISPSDKQNNRFRIVYTGSFFGTYMNPKNFLVALSRFLEAFQLQPSDFEVIFAGSNSLTIKNLLSQLDLEKYVKLSGNVTHRKACELQKSADLLLVLLYSIAEAVNIVTAKLFEYLVAGAPVLAIAPEGEVSKIIEKTGTGMVSNPDDIDDIERCLALLYEKIHIKKELFPRNEEEIKKFNRRDQAKRLAEIFDEVSITNKKETYISVKREKACN